jgi:hypothetical protein
VFRRRTYRGILARCRSAAPDLVRRLAAAQVPLADNNARKPAHALSTSARNPAADLPERL